MPYLAKTLLLFFLSIHLLLERRLVSASPEERPPMKTNKQINKQTNSQLYIHCFTSATVATPDKSPIGTAAAAAVPAAAAAAAADPLLFFCLCAVFRVLIKPLQTCSSNLCLSLRQQTRLCLYTAANKSV